MIEKEKLVEYLNLQENTYLDLYIQLICNNKETRQKRFLTQKHHIIPKYYFRRNNKFIDNSCDNVVNLTYSDHILAHIYLGLCCKDKRDRYSNFCAINKLLGEKYLQKINLKQLLHDISKNVDNYNDLYADYLSYNSEKSRKHHESLSEEEKKLINEKRISTIATLKTVHKDNYEIRVPEDQLNIYLEQGFILGRSEINRIKMSEAKKGSTPWNKGKKMPVELWEKRLKTIDKKIANGYTFPKASIDRKNKISLQNKGRIYIHRYIDGSLEVKTVKQPELKNYIEQGWIKGNPRAATNKGYCIVNDGKVNYRIKREELENYLSIKGMSKGSIKQSPIKNYIWVNDGERSTRISEEKLTEYLNKGFKKGFKSKRWSHE